MKKAKNKTDTSEQTMNQKTGIFLNLTHRKDDVCQIPIVLLYSELWGFPIKENSMPVKKVNGGYQWGNTGKVYPTREQAERQGRAIERSGYTEQGRKTKKGNK